MFYSEESIPEAGTYYLQLKIVETLYGMISIGVMSENKKNQECVYCDATDIYYIYCKNANIYNGKYLDININTNLLHRSRKTRIDNVKSGDIVTMFIDNNDKKVYWYVNNRYIAS